MQLFPSAKWTKLSRVCTCFLRSACSWLWLNFDHLEKCWCSGDYLHPFLSRGLQVVWPALLGINICLRYWLSLLPYCRSELKRWPTQAIYRCRGCSRLVTSLFPNASYFPRNPANTLSAMKPHGRICSCNWLGVYIWYGSIKQDWSDILSYIVMFMSLTFMSAGSWRDLYLSLFHSASTCPIRRVYCASFTVRSERSVVQCDNILLFSCTSIGEPKAKILKRYKFLPEEILLDVWWRRCPNLLWGEPCIRGIVHVESVICALLGGSIKTGKPHCCTVGNPCTALV